MTISVWCLIFTIAVCCRGLYAVPINSHTTAVAPRENINSISTHLKELSIWSHNSLQIVRGVSRALEKVISEEFDQQLKKSPKTAVNRILRQLLSFSSKAQKYVDIIKLALPATLVEQSKAFPEMQVYRKVYDFFKAAIAKFRNFAGQLLISYNYYLSEISFIKCIGKYVKETYPKWISRPVTAFPIKFMKSVYDWALEFLQTFVNEKTLKSLKNADILNDSKKGIYYQSSSKNEIDFNEVLLPGGPSRGKQVKKDETPSVEQTLMTLFNFDEIIAEQLDWKEKTANGESIVPATKCIQLYALEALWDHLEKFLMPSSSS